MSRRLVTIKFGNTQSIIALQKTTMRHPAKLAGKMAKPNTTIVRGKQGFLSLIGTLGIFSLLGIAVLAGRMPMIVWVCYCSMSIATFIAYAIDKAAAKHGSWRIRESTLHLLAFLGGWPGAWAAQALLRHKSLKQAFRTMFYGTVIANCGVLAWLLTSQKWTY